MLSYRQISRWILTSPISTRSEKKSPSLKIPTKSRIISQMP